MSFFDHAKCPGCGAHLDPERLAGTEAGPACPKCGTTLDLKHLFGLRDAFADDDEDGNALSLDDLVGGGPARRAPSGGSGSIFDDEPAGPRALLPKTRR